MITGIWIKHIKGEDKPLWWISESKVVSLNSYHYSLEFNSSDNYVAKLCCRDDRTAATFSSRRCRRKSRNVATRHLRASWHSWSFSDIILSERLDKDTAEEDDRISFSMLQRSSCNCCWRRLSKLSRRAFCKHQSVTHITCVPLTSSLSASEVTKLRCYTNLRIITWLCYFPTLASSAIRCFKQRLKPSRQKKLEFFQHLLSYDLMALYKSVYYY